MKSTTTITPARITSVMLALAAAFQVRAVEPDVAPSPALLQAAFPGVDPSYFAPRTRVLPPAITLQFARTWGSTNVIEATFSVPVSLATATNAANYSLTPAAIIDRIVPGTNSTSVRIHTRSSVAAPEVAHVLTVSGVQDQSVPANTIPAASQAILVKAQGFIDAAIYGNIGGGAVSDLTNNARFPASPDFTTFQSQAEGPVNLGDSYGTRLRGLVHPPVTGDYYFYLAADETASLLLSTNADPANRLEVAVVPSAVGHRQWVGFASQVSPAIRLEAGRAYHLEALMKEGGGADHVAVNWRLRGMPLPLNGDPPIPGAFLSTMIPSSRVRLHQAPTNRVVTERQPATFSVMATGTPVYAYQWYRGGIAIPRATATNYTLASVNVADQGATFTVVASNWFSSVTSSPVTLTVRPDTNPPVLVRATGGTSMDNVFLTFNEAVNPVTAVNPRNYVLSGGLTALTAALQADGSNVVLTTERQSDGQVYSVTATGVRDLAAGANAAPTTANFTAWVLTRGFVHREIFSGISGGVLTDLTGNPRFPHAFDAQGELPALESPSGQGDNFGERIRGYLLPTVSGYYTFYLAADEQSALYLGTDANPAIKVLIASEPVWNGFRDWTGTDRRTAGSPENRSLPILLQAGQSYYLEILRKEGGGGDNLGVAWQLPDAAVPVNGDAPIGGAHLATYANPAGTSLAITQQPPAITVAETDSTNLTVGVAASTNLVFYQWQRNGVDVPGANGPAYQTPRLMRTDHGVQYRCLVTIPGRTLYSAASVVTVVTDNAPPLVTSAACLAAGTTIGLCFNELLATNSVTNAINYVMGNGALFRRASLRPDGRSIALELASGSPTNFIIRVSGVRDLAGNFIAVNSPVTVSVSPFESTDVGAPGTDPLVTGSAFTCRDGDYDVIAGGSEFWNSTDRGQVLYAGRTGDFDVAVRVARQDPTGPGAEAGLLARESLAGGSRGVLAAVEPPTGANIYFAGYRGAENGGYAYFPGSGNVSPVPIPHAWIRLRRQGDVFTAFRGTNGVDWTQYAQMTLALSNRLQVGLFASAQNNTAAGAGTVWFRDWRSSPAPDRPTPLDLLIKPAASAAGSYAANNIYQSTPSAGQLLQLSASPTNPAIFAVKLENDGMAMESPVLRAVESKGGDWTVTYRHLGRDVSAVLRGPGLVVTNLAPGTAAELTAEFLPAATVAAGARRSARISVAGLPATLATRDVVEAVAVSEWNHQPDLAVRRLNDVVYRGVHLYNADAAGQSKQSVVDPETTAVYPVQLVNDGNLTNQFSLVGTGDDAGWSVRYYDALNGGADFTADVVNGTSLVTLIPGGTYEFRIEVTPGPGVSPGAVKDVLLTATSALNPSRRDAIRVITQSETSTNVPQGGTYTTDADFEKGVLVGLAYGGDQLQLSPSSITLPFIWVPNSNEGTVSKVDTRTGREVGRYRVSARTDASPSRTTVDLRGNCWLGNRVVATVVKIGLYEAGQYVDRNRNGIIETSRDLNGDGDITGAEILPWGSDECVYFEVSVNPGAEATFTPGDSLVPYLNDYWNPGPRGVAVDARGNLWVGTYGSKKFYYIDGETGRILRTNDFNSVTHNSYGAVIDPSGILWSASLANNNIMRLDPATGLFSIIPLNHQTYGINVDRSGHLYVNGWTSARISRLSLATGLVEWNIAAPTEGRGIAVTEDGDFWTANSGPGQVNRFTADGVLKATIAVGNQPTGVSVDAAGKVWVVNTGDEYIHRIDPAVNAIDLSKRILGGTHYGYSDMTGVISRNATTRFGTWTVIHNGKVEFTPWQGLSWHGTNLLTTNLVGGIETANTNVVVRVRSSHDRRNWSPWERVENSTPLATTPPGQFLEIEVTLQAFQVDLPPVLYDLTVVPVPQGTANLSVTQQVTPVNPVYSGYATNLIRVTNAGPQTARGTILTNHLPATWHVTESSVSQGYVTQAIDGLRFVLGNLPAGGTATARVVTFMNGSGPVAVGANVRSYDVDPAPADNSVVTTLEVAALPCVTLTDGLIQWWPGDFGGQNLASPSRAFAYNGATNAPGRSGLAFSFDGINEYMEVPDSPGLHSGRALTVMGWVHVNAFDREWQSLVWKGNTPDCGTGGCEGREYTLWLNRAGYLLFTSTPSNRVGAAEISVQTPGVITRSNWFHFAARISADSNSMQIYVNGQLQASGAYNTSGIRSTTGPLRIGRAPATWGETAFNGRIDEVMIHARALGTNEITAHYQSGAGSACKGSLAPPLFIEEIAPNLVMISWTTEAEGFRLTYTDSVPATGPWVTESEPPFVDQGRYRVIVPALHPLRAYRLEKP